MALHRIDHKPEHGPFQATVGTDCGFDNGMIRIEPPFILGDGLTYLTDGFDVNLIHTTTTEDATLLAYAISSRSQSNLAANIERVESALGEVLISLGHTASAELFDQYWENIRK